MAISMEVALRYVTGLKQITVGGAGNTRTEYNGPCPLCGGKDRFYMFEKAGTVRWWCRQGHNHHYNIPEWYGSEFFAENLIYLITGRRPDNGYNPDPELRRDTDVSTRDLFPDPPMWEDMRQHVTIPMERIEQYSQNTDKVMSYFGEYGIRADVLRQYKIGYAVNPPSTGVPAGWSIPNLSRGRDGLLALRGVQFRRHDSVCRTELTQRDNKWIEMKLRELEEVWADQTARGFRSPDAPKVASIDDLLEKLYPKYTSMAPSENGIWGDDLVTLPGLEREGKWLPYCFVVESVKCALVLRQEGYPAVAYKRRGDWDAWLPRVFKNITNVYIIGDNDKDWRGDSPGLVTAKSIQKSVDAGRLSYTRVLQPPDPYKQVSDMAKAKGVDAVREWIASRFSGLEPMPITENEAV